MLLLHKNESGMPREGKFSAYRSMPISRATENDTFVVMANAPTYPANLRSPSQFHDNSQIIHLNGNGLMEAAHFDERLVISDIDPEDAPRRFLSRAMSDDTILNDCLRRGAELATRQDNDAP